jgi:hypothetical protein
LSRFVRRTLPSTIPNIVRLAVFRLVQKLKNFSLRCKSNRSSFRGAPTGPRERGPMTGSARARNPYSRWWLWIPGLPPQVGNCRPKAHPGMTMEKAKSIARRANQRQLTFPPCPAPSEKIFLFFRNRIGGTSLAIPSHMRGVSRSSRTLERDAVDAAASGAMRSQGGSMRPVSDRTAPGRKTLPPSLKLRRTGT